MRHFDIVHRPFQRLAHTGLALLTAAALAGCGGGGGGGGTGPGNGGGNGTGGGGGGGSGSGSISMVNNQFSPQVDTVSAGTTVTWSNNNGVTHTATSDNNIFDTGDVAPSASASTTFNSTGTFDYHCIYHGSPGAGMHGTIVVE